MPTPPEFHPEQYDSSPSSPAQGEPGPSRKGKNLPLILAALAAIVLFAAAGIFLVNSLIQKESVTTQEPATIGDSRREGGIVYTLDRVQLSSGSEFFPAQEGYQYLICSLTIQNDTSEPFAIDENHYYIALDGKVYEPYAIPDLVITELEPEVESYRTDTGALTFEVPISESYALQIYDPEGYLIESFSFDDASISVLNIEELPEAGLAGDQAAPFDGQSAQPGQSVLAENGVTYTLLSFNVSEFANANYLHCLVRIDNTSGTLKTYNAYDWMLVYPDGSQSHVSVDSAGGVGDDLKAGNLVLNQSVEGLVNYEIQDQKEFELRVYTNTFTYDTPLAAWKISLNQSQG